MASHTSYHQPKRSVYKSAATAVMMHERPLTVIAFTFKEVCLTLVRQLAYHSLWTDGNGNPVD